jgi:preflagellin peptidase FlaK
MAAFASLASANANSLPKNRTNSVFPDVATLPDLLRLVVVPVFGWAAWTDIKTRRIPNRTWYPLVVFGALLVLWDGWLVANGMVVGSLQLFLVRLGLSLGIVVPFAYAFWWFGGFGGADAKALMTLALLFPVYPTYYFPGFTLPWLETTVGVFSLTILSNTVLVGLAYPLATAVRNAVGGHVAKAMFIGKPIQWSAATTEYGRLLETPEGFTRRGLDLDALRMYLNWRDCTLEDLRADPERYRDPATLPDDPGDPGDGSIPRTDGGTGPGGEATADDPWGAAAFLEAIEGSAYGTTPEQLRDGIEVLTSEDVVWLSPGIPFVVPMFGGLVVSLIAGDVLVWLMSLVGLA